MCLLAGDILDIEVVHRGEMVVVEPLAGVHRGEEEEIFDLPERAVVEEDIADESATIGVGFDVQTSFAVTAIGAILGKDLLDTVLHLATQDDTMQPLETAVADDDSRGWCGSLATIVIAAAFDGYVVVAIVKLDVLNQHILRIFGVDTIVVDQLGIVAQGIAKDVFRAEQVDAPKGGIDYFYTLQRDALALEKLNQLGTQVLGR